MNSKENKRMLTLTYVLILSLVLFALATYYVVNQNKMDRGSALVGDEICRHMISDAAQDACCLQAHENDAHIECIGRWQYVSGLKKCQYICDNHLPSCTEELKTCDDKTTVTRNASLDCEFNPC